jgi:hypothetical protein
VLPNALSITYRTILAKQSYTNELLHLTCAGKSEGFGETDDRRRLCAASLRDDGQRFEREVVRLIKYMTRDPPEAIA